jgi:DNA-binding response OmpR family regulator
MEKILVVNNDFDTMNLLKKWLEKKSYQVDYTSSTQNIPTLVKDLHASLVIVDILQKDVVDKIKNDSDTRNVPVLLMTGYTSRANKKEVPFDDVIEKPFTLPLLEKKIETLIMSY